MKTEHDNPVKTDGDKTQGSGVNTKSRDENQGYKTETQEPDTQEPGDMWLELLRSGWGLKKRAETGTMHAKEDNASRIF